MSGCRYGSVPQTLTAVQQAFTCIVIAYRSACLTCLSTASTDHTVQAHPSHRQKSVDMLHSSNHAVAESAADLFLARTRVGVSGTLHRISAMKDSRGEVYGLTYRIGRHIEGKSHVPCAGKELPE